MKPPDPARLARLDALGAGLPFLSAQPLPPYRYIPGLNAHPKAYPKGYIHGLQTGPIPALPPEAWARSVSYLQGCDLYNRGYWWEAHEAWEGLWQVTRDRPRQHRFLQGLIQAANAQLKLALDLPRAVRRLWDKAEDHFVAAQGPEPFMGMALEPWRRSTGIYLTTRLEAGGGWHDPASFPCIKLQNSPDLPWPLPTTRTIMLNEDEGEPPCR
ncbi:MAG: DUF309 domain-containing protein [Pseudomonadota bacterium]